MSLGPGNRSITTDQPNRVASQGLGTVGEEEQLWLPIARLISSGSLAFARLLQSSHAIPMQPEKPHCELSQIVSAWTNGKPSCAAQGVRSLLFQGR